MNHPEILAPAGDFEAGVVALKAGADAVYCGLREFSARRAATNLSRDDLRRLVSFAQSSGRRVYVTLNTVIRDDEMDRAANTLAFLEAAGADAVILQDLGLLYVARKVAPSLPIHASTQMGIHTPLGAAWAKREGISRVILARELTLGEIARIRERVPDLELEVFIHGALCYGFSGLCLASNAITGRSGNRGECAQICRTWFEVDGRKEYPFSSQDLVAGPAIRDLADLGVVSLKIEGRMKSHTYVASTVAWYRSIFDGSGDTESQERSTTAFSRERGSGFLGGRPGITGDYPGHRGLPLGEVKAQEGDRFLLETTKSVAMRDGLQFLASDDKAVGFAAHPLEITPSGVWLKNPTPKPPVGTLISKVSDHDSAIKGEKPGAYPLPPLGPRTEFTVNDGELVAACSIGGISHTKRWKVETSEARNPEGLGERLADLFVGVPLTTEGAVGRFIPPSSLKMIRREFFTWIGEVLDRVVAPELPGVSPPKTQRIKRTDMSRGPIPFSDRRDLRSNVTLPPVQPEDEDEWVSALMAVNTPLVLGLSNPAHLELARRLASEKKLECWTDYGLYAGNRFAVEYLKDVTPGLRAVSPWIEDPDPSMVESRGVAAVDMEGFNPPLFISRNCFEARGGRCPRNCPRRGDKRVTQRGASYQVTTRNCLSYVTRAV